MVIILDEKDKSKIEYKGMTVIEAKRILYKAVKVFQPIFDRLWDICKNIDKEQIEKLLKEQEESP